MAAQDKTPAGPDLTRGVSVVDVRKDGKLLGHVGDAPVLLVQLEEGIVAIGALCTHYHGPLVDGLVVGGTVRCPWHHACFDLRTGQALRAPALDPVVCWRVELDGDRILVKEKLPAPTSRGRQPASSRSPDSVVIVGGGGAGLAAADTLRREGYDGSITMISADEAAPYDRPNLSKDFLAGRAPEDWMPLRDAEYYTTQRIDLVPNTRVTALDTAGRRVITDNGASHTYAALLLATGAEPVRLTVPGAASARVHYLRSFADARAIIAALPSSTRAAVVGASFIGLEVAASLRARGLDVHVIAPDARPMEKILGPDIGDFIRALHEAQGVVFHLKDTVTSIAAGSLTLSSGASFDADLIVVGIGVQPALSFIAGAGIATDRGIAVNEYLETSVGGVFAAGDIARWPDRHSGDRIRVEHWVVAERQGQVAARNMLGFQERFDAVPFFWSQHYDVTINYVGHAERWDRIDRDGQIEAQDCTLRFRQGDRTLAVATIGRDRDSLQSEVALEQSVLSRH